MHGEPPSEPYRSKTLRSAQDPDVDPPRTVDVLRALVANHREFLSFLERRVGRRDVAEDILQEAFARGLQRIEALRDDESAVVWFYRTLRSSVIDRHRRRGAEDRALAAFAAELTPHEQPTDSMRGLACACVSRLASALRSEYAEALQRIEVDGLSVKAFAEERGIKEGNAALRVLRARQALRRQLAASCGTCAEHGCLECSCGGPARREGSESE